METRQHTFSDRSTLTLMGPDALRPEGRIRFAYEVRLADGRVIDTDYISGGVGMDFPIDEAFASWLSFGQAYAERYRYTMAHGGTHPDGDPTTELHEWAYQVEDELQTLALDLEQTN
jgi:hypothetical protein